MKGFKKLESLTSHGSFYFFGFYEIHTWQFMDLKCILYIYPILLENKNNLYIFKAFAIFV